MSDPRRFDPEAVRQRVASDLRALAVPFNDNLPLADAVPGQPPKEDEAAARRIVILYALTGLAHEAKAERLWQWILTNEIAHEVTAAERDFFLKPLSKQAMIDLSWKQEALFTLGWAGSLVDRLDLPVGECRLDALFPVIPPEVEIPHFLRSFRLRPLGDLVYQTDLHFCLHWVVRHPEAWGESATARRLRLDVIRERRHTLEWLVGNATDWDDVALDT